jgi:chemotaxis-related protein WspB
MLMLLFYIGDDQFAIDCNLIIEIFPKINLTTVSKMPFNFAGLMNYGGIPVPVIDVVHLVENRHSTNSMHTRIVLLQHPSFGTTTYLGLICEKAFATIDLERSQFRDSGIKSKERSFLGGIYTGESKTIQYFDVLALYQTLVNPENSDEVRAHFKKNF